MPFRIRFWSTFFSILGLAILLSLGTWQLNRYVDAKSFEEQRDATMDEATTTVEAPSELIGGALDFHTIEVQGHWDRERLFLIKHRVYQGDPGFWVVNALLLNDSDDSTSQPTALLVNRGWIPFQDGYETAQTMLEELPQGLLSIQGLVHFLDGVVGDDDFRESLASSSNPTGLLVLESYDVTAMHDTLPFTTFERPIALTQSPVETALETEDQFPIPSHDHITDPYLTAETHMGYMLTWYLLALALIGIWIAGGLGMLKSSAYENRPDRET